LPCNASEIGYWQEMVGNGTGAKAEEQAPTQKRNNGPAGNGKNRGSSTYFVAAYLPRKVAWNRLNQTTTATTAHANPVQRSGKSNNSGKVKGEVVGSVHGNLFLYGQELASLTFRLAPCPRLRMVAGASLSLSLSASV